MSPFIEKNSNKIVFGLIALYVVFFLSVTLFRYRHFMYQDMDLALINQVFWNTLHGNWFYSSIWGGIILKGHLFWMVIPLLPVYKIYPHPTTLLILQSFFLGLAAWPLYLIARDKLGKTLGVIFALLYLLYPAVGYGNLYDFHLETLLPFFIFYCFYYFFRSKFRKYLIFLVLAVAVKEDMALFAVMLGLAALFYHRRKKWFLVSTAIGVVYLVLAFKFLIPYFNQGDYTFSVYYQALGRTPAEIIKTIITHPLATLKFMFTGPKLVYLLKLFAPVSFIAFLAPFMLLVGLPFFLESLLSSYAPLYEINFYYGLTLTPFIFIAAIYGVRRVVKFRLVGIILLAAGIVCNILFAPHLSLARQALGYKVDYLEEISRGLIEHIPAEAPVVATFSFLAELSNRPEVYSFHYVFAGFDKLTGRKYELPESVEYALLDFRDNLTFHGFNRPSSAANFNRFLTEGSWGVVESVGPVALLRKNTPTRMKLIEKIEADYSAEDEIKIMGYKILPDEVNQDFVIIMVDWHCGKDLAKEYSMRLGGHYFDPTYNIYPTRLWRRGESYRTFYRLRTAESYDLVIFDPRTGEVIEGIRMQ